MNTVNKIKLLCPWSLHSSPFEVRSDSHHCYDKNLSREEDSEWEDFILEREFRKALTEDELTFGQRWEWSEGGRQAQYRGKEEHVGGCWDKSKLGIIEERQESTVARAQWTRYRVRGVWKWSERGREACIMDIMQGYYAFYAKCDGKTLEGSEQENSNISFAL